MITVSAPGKIHLLGEHVVVYSKPALLTTVDLRVTVSITKSKYLEDNKLKKIIEPIIKRSLKIGKIPAYHLSISSQFSTGIGLGSSAAISAAYIAALLTFLKVKWDLNLINKLTYEAEKIFHGHPSGADNSTVVFGGLIWFRKETSDLKLIHQLPYSIPKKIAKNFVLINTGKPKENTREMVELVNSKFKVQSAKFKKIFDNQEELIKQLPQVIQNNDEKKLIAIIRAGGKNLEKLGVVSSYVESIIRKIEKAGGAGKICGGGGKTGPTGILLCYHPKPSIIQNIAKEFKLDYIRAKLGAEGLRSEFT